jgi:tetratricopeptide (TPR) repeat protein
VEVKELQQMDNQSRPVLLEDAEKRLSHRPSDHFVAYMDILGYKDYFADQSNKIGEFFEAVKMAFEKATTEIQNIEPHDITQIKLFSDNILISVKCSDDDELENVRRLLRLAQIVAHIQLIFFHDYGLVLRGALVKGLFYIHKEGKYVFGQALIDAVTMEKDEAVYPRVVIKNEIVDEIISLIRTKDFADEGVLASTTFTLLARDGDKRYFVNYLPIDSVPPIDARLFDVMNIFPVKPLRFTTISMFNEPVDKIRETLFFHREQLTKKLSDYGNYNGIDNEYSEIETRRSVMSKYLWMLDFYNKVCSITGNEDFLLHCTLSTDESTHQPKVNMPPQEELDTILSNDNATRCQKDLDYPKAKEWYLRTLHIREEVLGKENPYTAKTYNNLGGVFFDMGEYSQALECFNKALSIFENAPGAEDSDIATTYTNIGDVYWRMDNYTQALEWHNRALIIREKTLGTEHPDTAETYNEIGLVYSDMGDDTQALELYHKALGIQEKVLGVDHPDTAITYNNIGLEYSNVGDYPQALEWYNKSLRNKEEMLGHPDIAITYINIAGVYAYMCDYPQALVWYQKALPIFENKLGSQHPHTILLYNGIANTYADMGNEAEAEKWQQKAKQAEQANKSPLPLT